jgi:2-isopropylmalate synthase
LVDNVSNIGDAVISTHCHNDLGLAVANSLEGVRRGARQVECTMNGLGERAGNASLEEIVMSIHTRSDYFPGLTTAISTEQIVPTSQMVSRMTGMHVQANKSIVGANAFAHESGIHQDGMLKHRETYEIMTPADVGWSKSRMVLGRHSGRHGFQSRLEALGYHVADEDLDRAYERFLLVADKKKEVFDEDLAAIIDDEVREVVQTFKLEHLQVSSGTGTIPSATVRIKVLDEMRQEAAWGDGPVDAAYTAITKAAGVDVTLEEYVIRAVTSGRKALGEVSVRIREKEKTVLGRGASTDVVEASTKAFIDALNRLTEQRSGENG